MSRAPLHTMIRMIFAIWLMLPGAAAAMPNSSIVYTHEKLVIEPAAPSPPSPSAAPTPEGRKTGAETPPPAPRRPVGITVTIRPLAALSREGFYAHKPFKGVDGILFAADAPEALQVVPMNFYAPADILAVDEDGVITHILPGLVPSELAHSIRLPGNLLALLYLPGGFAERHGVRPRDKILHPLFARQPLILQ